jgi:cytochrome c2
MLQILVALTVFLAATVGTGRDAHAEATEGEKIFRTQCANCHSLTPGVSSIAPDLHGVLGRKAGSLNDFKYSADLKGADFNWTAKKLDEWLKSPHQAAPETDMAFKGLASEKDRAQTIEFLKTLK